MARSSGINGRWSLPIVTVLFMLLAVPAAMAQDEAPSWDVQLGFGTGMDRETRALTGEATTFSAGTERVFCRMHITGVATPTQVTHVWYLDGKTMAQVDLQVGSSNWRTWSSKRLLPSWTGFWEVKVLDQTGKVLATSSFTVE